MTPFAVDVSLPPSAMGNTQDQTQSRVGDSQTGKNVVAGQAGDNRCVCVRVCVRVRACMHVHRGHHHASLWRKLCVYM